MVNKITAICEPGSICRVNEDLCGHADNWAWVMDGFTPSSLPPVMGAASDAAWFVAFADGRIRELIKTNKNGVDIIRQVCEEAQEEFLGRAPERKNDPLSWPGAALTLMYNNIDLFQFWNLADTMAYISFPGKPVQVFGEGAAMRQKESNAAREILSASRSCPDKVLKTEIFSNWLRHTRQKYEKNKNYDIFGLFPQAADQVRYWSVKRQEKGERVSIILMSDGFSSLVELYKDISPDALFVEIEKEDLNPLMARIRHIEKEIDPDGKKYPRFKQSDDATALFISC